MACRRLPHAEGPAAVEAHHAPAAMPTVRRPKGVWAERSVSSATAVTAAASSPMSTTVPFRIPRDGSAAAPSSSSRPSGVHRPAAALIFAGTHTQYGENDVLFSCHFLALLDRWPSRRVALRYRRHWPHNDLVVVAHVHLRHRAILLHRPLDDLEVFLQPGAQLFVTQEYPGHPFQGDDHQVGGVREVDLGNELGILARPASISCRNSR